MDKTVEALNKDNSINMSTGYTLDERNLWKEEVREIYKNVKSHTKSYEFDFLGTNLTIFPNVFSSKDFNNTKWYAGMNLRNSHT